jgi:hypothetical protein
MFAEINGEDQHIVTPFESQTEAHDLFTAGYTSRDTYSFYPISESSRQAM